MTKWADYCISKVEYNPSHTHIIKTEVHKDNDDNLSAASEWARTDVVTSIKNGYTFITIFKNEKGEWTKGQEVRIIKVDGTEYIRTDANSKQADNLDRLPEF